MPFDPDSATPHVTSLPPPFRTSPVGCPLAPSNPGSRFLKNLGQLK